MTVTKRGGFPYDRVADQPVKLDRIAAAIDHPDDQVASLAGGRGNSGLGVVREHLRCYYATNDSHALGIEEQAPVDRRLEVKARLGAARADPVGPHPDTLVCTAGRELGAGDADLELGYSVDGLPAHLNVVDRSPDELWEDQHAPRRLGVIQRTPGRRRCSHSEDQQYEERSAQPLHVSSPPLSRSSSEPLDSVLHESGDITSLSLDELE